MRPKAAVREVSRIRGIRSSVEALLKEKSNVIGSMIGLKSRENQLTDQVSLVVFVSQKLPADKLLSEHRIPDRIKIKGMSVQLDVLPYAGMTFQASGPFPDGSLTTFDGIEYGTMTAFARTQFEIYGLTCAHAVEGLDNNAYSPSPVAIWSPTHKKAIPVGQSAIALAGGGAGVPGAFGFSDAALFTLADSSLRKRALAGTQIPVAAPKFGEPVFGTATSGAKVGKVVGIEQRVGIELADLVVQVTHPGTFRGDSGMLWRNAKGQAIGIHAKGDGNGPGVGSGLTAAMSAFRAAAGLQIAFINP
ncbi:hypothetical protein [Variovorax fucosicus]|uniref:hypothetical protein n=1 Tax=Variovorax fucosicus TaxID=3053517 RepID=UPI002578DE64|nr:hypothetical protein [Variovorax sp. J22G47]MDM0059016.1 hypothetical protein [Variovorax sp. J22G47]